MGLKASKAHSHSDCTIPYPPHSPELYPYKKKVTHENFNLREISLDPELNTNTLSTAIIMISLQVSVPSLFLHCAELVSNNFKQFHTSQQQE